MPTIMHFLMFFDSLAEKCMTTLSLTGFLEESSPKLRFCYPNFKKVHPDLKPRRFTGLSH
jgi:hypothetical protein